MLNIDVLGKLALLLALSALPGCYAAQSESPSAVPSLSSAELRELTPAEKKIIGDGIAGGLKDPGVSAV